MKARSLARIVSVTLMGVLVLGATADGFAQSWSGLYQWALEHGLTGWKAMAFPGMVDSFIGIGELGLFLLAIDGHRLRKSVMSWADLLIPAAVAVSGWGASLVFNVGRVQHHDFATQATAAVPPLASMIGLVVLLRTLHRYVTRDSAEPVSFETPLAVVDPKTVAFEEMEDTPEALLAWLKGEDVPAVPSVPDPHRVAALEMFGDEVRAGKVPGIHRIKKRLHIGQPKAQEVQAYLSVLANQ